MSSDPAMEDERDWHAPTALQWPFVGPTSRDRRVVNDDEVGPRELVLVTFKNESVRLDRLGQPGDLFDLER